MEFRRFKALFLWRIYVFQWIAGNSFCKVSGSWDSTYLRSLRFSSQYSLACSRSPIPAFSMSAANSSNIRSLMISPNVTSCSPGDIMNFSMSCIILRYAGLSWETKYSKGLLFIEATFHVATRRFLPSASSIFELPSKLAAFLLRLVAYPSFAEDLVSSFRSTKPVPTPMGRGFRREPHRSNESRTNDFFHLFGANETPWFSKRQIYY